MTEVDELKYIPSKVYSLHLHLGAQKQPYMFYITRHEISRLRPLLCKSLFGVIFSSFSIIIILNNNITYYLGIVPFIEWHKVWTL